MFIIYKLSNCISYLARNGTESYKRAPQDCYHIHKASENVAENLGKSNNYPCMNANFLALIELLVALLITTAILKNQQRKNRMAQTEMMWLATTVCLCGGGIRCGVYFSSVGQN